jgi:hypothetical protein
LNRHERSHRFRLHFPSFLTRRFRFSIDRADLIAQGHTGARKPAFRRSHEQLVVFGLITRREGIRKELERFQGDWVMEAIQSNGYKMSAERLKTFSRSVKDDTYTIKIGLTPSGDGQWGSFPTCRAGLAGWKPAPRVTYGISTLAQKG